MAKPRRNVKFAHRSNLNTSSDFGGSRRDSLSGDDGSPLSPLRNGVTVDGADSHTGSRSPVLKVLSPTETKQRQELKSADTCKNTTPGRASSSVRVRKEETNIHNSDNMDTGDDRNLLLGYGGRPYLHRGAG